MTSQDYEINKNRQTRIRQRNIYMHPLCWIKMPQYTGQIEVKVHTEHPFGETIRIHHKREGGLEKSVPRITVGHHETCRVMKNGNQEGSIFLVYSQTNNEFFFLLIIYYLFINQLSENPEYAEMQYHMMTSLRVNTDVT